MSEASATALVIDDEALVRQMVRRMLEPDLCRVIEAGDGEAGLRLLEQDGPTIDVVLTDLLMPGIDGYDVVEVLTAHRPELPVVCMSGFASHTSLGRRLAVPFIPKPFDADAMRGLLQPLIAQARAARATAADQRRLSLDLQAQGDAARAMAVSLVEAAHALRRQRAADPLQH